MSRSYFKKEYCGRCGKEINNLGLCQNCTQIDYRERQSLELQKKEAFANQCFRSEQKRRAWVEEHQRSAWLTEINNNSYQEVDENEYHTDNQLPYNEPFEDEQSSEQEMELLKLEAHLNFLNKKDRLNKNSAIYKQLDSEGRNLLFVFSKVIQERIYTVNPFEKNKEIFNNKVLSVAVKPIKDLLLFYTFLLIITIQFAGYLIHYDCLSYMVESFFGLSQGVTTLIRFTALIGLCLLIYCIYNYRIDFTSYCSPSPNLTKFTAIIEYRTFWILCIFSVFSSLVLGDLFMISTFILLIYMTVNFIRMMLKNKSSFLALKKQEQSLLQYTHISLMQKESESLSVLLNHSFRIYHSNVNFYDQSESKMIEDMTSYLSKHKTDMFLPVFDNYFQINSTLKKITIVCFFFAIISVLMYVKL